MPEEEQAWFPKEEVLSYDEMLRVLRVGAGLGIRKVRVTGGEPLTRPGVTEFCSQISAIPGIEQVGISTNGTLLSKAEGDSSIAKQLVKAGVKSANISLDSLDRAIYQQATSRDLLPRVLDGIDSAIDAGFESIRLNCVLMKNQTEREFVPLIDYARSKGALLRFIELMPVSTQEVLKEDRFLSVGVALKMVEEHFGKLTPLPDFKTNGPATYYEIASTGQKIGFIGAMTNLHFCENCNKLRLTSDGKLRPCLGSFLEFDLKSVLRNGCSDSELADFIRSVVARKPKEHDFRDNYQPNRRMIAIGG